MDVVPVDIAAEKITGGEGGGRGRGRTWSSTRKTSKQKLDRADHLVRVCVTGAIGGWWANPSRQAGMNE